MAKNKGSKGINIEEVELEDEEVSVPSGKKGKSKSKTGGKVDSSKEETKAKVKTAQPEHLKRELPEGYVSAEQLAEEFGKKGRDVRQVLRDNEFDKPESGRWAWHEKKEASTLKRLRGLLANGAPKKEKVVEEAPAKSKKGKDATPAPEEKSGKSKKKK